MKICKLLGPAQIDGEVREAGYHFMLKAGERGPHVSRAVRHEIHDASFNGHQGDFTSTDFAARWEDVPLFEVVEDLTPSLAPPEKEIENTVSQPLALPDLANRPTSLLPGKITFVREPIEPVLIESHPSEGEA